MSGPIHFSRLIAPSKLGEPAKGPPRLGSTLAVLDELPPGAYLIVPPGWRSWALERAPLKGVMVITDTGGIHGSLGDIPAGAVVGVGQDAFTDLHEVTARDVRAVLVGSRFSRVIWA